MLYLLGFLLFMVGFFIGGFFWLFIYVWYIKDKFESYLDNFEDRIDYSFKRYFKFPLFDKED